MPSIIDSLVTIVITTSPSPLHPSTTHIEKVIESISTFAPELAQSRKLIICDGCLVRDKSKFRSGRVTQDAFDRYKQYKHALSLSLANGGRPNTIYEGAKYELIELQERHGFGFAVRKAMFHHVKTPMVLVVQHDRTLMRPVDVSSIVRTMQQHQDTIGYVLLPIKSTNSYVNQWFSKFATLGIKGKEADLRSYKIEAVANEPTKEEQAEQKDQKEMASHLLPCFRWYDSTHFAFSNFYRDLVFSNDLKLVSRGGFIEDKLGQAQRSYYIVHGVKKAIAFWKMWIFQDRLTPWETNKEDDPNVSRMVAHLDGSSGGYSTKAMLDAKKKREGNFGGSGGVGGEGGAGKSSATGGANKSSATGGAGESSATTPLICGGGAKDTAAANTLKVESIQGKCSFARPIPIPIVRSMPAQKKQLSPRLPPPVAHTTTTTTTTTAAAAASRNARRPSTLTFHLSPSGATATAQLLWDKAPKTCAAIVAQLPIRTMCWHGRNSGAEALLITPALINDLPQDKTENATTTHAMGDVLFGFEAAGSCHGGAGSEDASEIAWIYGPAAQACYWLSEKGPPHEVGPFKRVPAELNVFAKITTESGFYTECAKLQRKGEQQIVVAAGPGPTTGGVGESESENESVGDVGEQKNR